VRYPYGLCADLHAHAWSAFSSVDENGTNTRLLHIIDELDRLCTLVRRAGGNIVVFAGDLFHERGKIVPSVFNPLHVCIQRWIDRGIDFRGIPGNHDCEGKEVSFLTSAAAMMQGEVGFHLIHKEFAHDDMCMYVPWKSSPAAYLSVIADAADSVSETRRSALDLIIHAGIDGTLSDMPPHGITAEALAKFGFRRVFSGHYHHHKDFGNGVFSIGATTHQTWSDVGTQAGFMMVYADREEFHASYAPQFIDITGDEDPAELGLKIEGHYVRAKIGTASATVVGDMRALLMREGALGVQIMAVPNGKTVTRAGVAPKSLSSVEQSVLSYVDEQKLSERVRDICSEIMTEVKEVA